MATRRSIGNAAGFDGLSDEIYRCCCCMNNVCICLFFLMMGELGGWGREKRTHKCFSPMIFEQTRPRTLWRMVYSSALLSTHYFAPLFQPFTCLNLFLLNFCWHRLRLLWHHPFWVLFGISFEFWFHCKIL